VQTTTHAPIILDRAPLPAALVSYARTTSALLFADPGFIDAVGLGCEREQAMRESAIMAGYLAGVQAHAQRPTEESQRGVRAHVYAAGLAGGR
jgi:hypothetical protein